MMKVVDVTPSSVAVAAGALIAGAAIGFKVGRFETSVYTYICSGTV